MAMLGHADCSETVRGRQTGKLYLFWLCWWRYKIPSSFSAALKQVLNLNQPIPTTLAVEPVWKLLIIDKTARDILSPLMQLKELREAGVTLHLYVFLVQVIIDFYLQCPFRMLDAKRECLPDVPAVYLFSPTAESVRLICEDMRKALYDSYYFNSLSPTPRPLLEELAEAAVRSSQVQAVQRVTDQFLNFITLEDDLFMLRRVPGGSSGGASEEEPSSFAGNSTNQLELPRIPRIISK